MDKATEALSQRQGKGISDEENEAYLVGYADAVRDVVEALRGEWAKGRLSNRETQQDAADFIEREFADTQNESCEDCGGTGQRVLNPNWPSGEGSHSEKCSTCGGSGKRS